MTQEVFVKKGTNKTPEALKQINEALFILSTFGIPTSDTPRRLEKMAIAFLAVAGMDPSKNWKDVKSNDDHHRLTSREIIIHVNRYYGESISPGSYDDIRRKDLKYLTVAGIVMNSAANPNAATNNPTRRYALAPEYAELIKKFSDKNWQKVAIDFMQGKKALSLDLAGEREIRKIPITFGKNTYEFTPGEHNQIQKAVVEEFLPRYGYGAEVLYIGDTANKYLFLNREKLKELNFFEISHGELPDVIAYSKDKNWLYLIEAVHSANPINPLRHHELKRLTAECTAGIIYVTAFLDRKVSQKFIGEIAWETEVWIAETPDHLIHFNGDRFLGPHS